VKELPIGRKVRPVVLGRATNSRLKSVYTKRNVDMFISRLHPATEGLHANVSDVCGSVRVDSIDCNRLQSRYEELYSSFHVCVKVNAADFERAIVVLNDPESWPDGALIRRYFRPRSKHGEPTGPN